MRPEPEAVAKTLTNVSPASITVSLSNVRQSYMHTIYHFSTNQPLVLVLRVVSAPPVMTKLSI